MGRNGEIRDKDKIALVKESVSAERTKRLTICQQLEIVFSAYAGCFQVVLDDKRFDRIISGENDGALDAGFKVGPVTSLLPDKFKPMC